jgi:3D (Asp-Asp-Asp) domain-containing protein
MGGKSMNIQTTARSIVRGNLAKIVVIALMSAIGAAASIDISLLDHPDSEGVITEHSRQYSTSSEAVKFTVMRVTAYTVGDPAQTDASPCIGAGNENLCRALAKGEKVCAANFVPLNTYLHIRGHGIYRVADRMHGRFENSVDIAMAAHQKHKAVKFGAQDLPVRVLD